MTVLERPPITTGPASRPAARPKRKAVAPEDPSPAPVPAPAAASVDFAPILIRSVGWASLIMLVGTGLPLWAFTGSAWDGIGLGAFCAFWGGPGFGTMAAGARLDVADGAATRGPTGTVGSGPAARIPIGRLRR